MNSPSPEELRALRTWAGLTQSQCAAFVYVTLGCYQKWEQGDRAMPAASWELMNWKIAIDRFMHPKEMRASTLDD